MPLPDGRGERRVVAARAHNTQRACTFVHLTIGDTEQRSSTTSTVVATVAVERRQHLFALVTSAGTQNMDHAGNIGVRFH